MVVVVDGVDGDGVVVDGVDGNVRLENPKL